MLIALDHDGTYTLDPVVWNAVIKAFQDRGHSVHIVTLRHAELDRLRIEKELTNLGVRVVYCDGRPKKEVAHELGLEYDIWIEDDPQCIHEGSRLSYEALAAWRARDKHRG